MLCEYLSSKRGADAKQASTTASESRSRSTSCSCRGFPARPGLAQIVKSQCPVNLQCIKVDSIENFREILALEVLVARHTVSLFDDCAKVVGWQQFSKVSSLTYVTHKATAGTCKKCEASYLGAEPVNGKISKIHSECRAAQLERQRKR